MNGGNIWFLFHFGMISWREDGGSGNKEGSSVGLMEWMSNCVTDSGWRDGRLLMNGRVGKEQRAMWADREEGSLNATSWGAHSFYLPFLKNVFMRAVTHSFHVHYFTFLTHYSLLPPSFPCYGSRSLPSSPISSPAYFPNAFFISASARSSPYFPVDFDFNIRHPSWLPPRWPVLHLHPSALSTSWNQSRWKPTCMASEGHACALI